MEKVILAAEKREEKGKTEVKKVRTSGYVPAVCYKDGKESFNIKVKIKDLHHVLHTKAGINVLITLKVDNEKKERLVIIKEIQTEPVKDKIMHVDFNEVSLTKKIKVKVKVVTRGQAKAVTAEGGVIEHILWELDVECLPTMIPEKIQVDITELKIGDSIQVKDIKVDEGVKVLNQPDLVVITAKPPAKEEVVEVVPGAEAEEPEVIAKGKKPVEGEEGAEAPADQPKQAAKEEKK